MYIERKDQKMSDKPIGTVNSNLVPQPSVIGQFP
jgi:hypothetical protein